jgi:pilus assembly protein CpaF
MAPPPVASRVTLSEPRPASRTDVPSMPPPARPAPAPLARPAPTPQPQPLPAPAPAPAAVARPEPVRRSVAPAPAPKPVGDDKRAKIVEVLQRAAARLASGADSSAEDIFDEVRGELPPGVDADLLARDFAAEVTGSGPLDELMADDGINEIAVTRFDRLFTDRGGSLAAIPRWFSSPEAVVRAAERLMARAGRTAEGEAARAVGVLEARLENGWLLRAALPPISARGAALSLRRPHRAGAKLSDLVGQGLLSQGMADFLDLAVKGRRNVVVAGPSGSGRTTLLSALARAADGARLVSVEESEELDLGDGPARVRRSAWPCACGPITSWWATCAAPRRSTWWRRWPVAPTEFSAP